MAFYIAFLILEVFGITFGVYMGYHRGGRKAAFRFCELLLAFVVSLFLAKAAASSFGSWVVDLVCALLNDSAEELINSSKNADALISAMVGALIAPLFFALFFGIIKLVSLIGFNTIANAIVKKTGEQKMKTRTNVWCGAGIGALSGVLVCSVFLSPFFCGLYIAGSVPEESREELAVQMGIDEGVAHEICRILPNSAPVHPVSMFVAKLVTTTTVSGVKCCAIDEMPKMFCMLGDFLSSYEEAREEGKDDIAILGSAISSTIPHIEDSTFISEITSSVLNSVGQSIKNGDDVIGVAGGARDDISDAVMNSVCNILTNISSKNIVDNIEILVGAPDNENDSGLLGIASELYSAEDLKVFIEQGKAAELAEMLIEIEENPNLESTMNAVRALGTSIFTESVLAGADEQTKEEYIEKISESVNNILSQTDAVGVGFRENVEIAEEIIKNAVFEKSLSEGEIRLLAVFAVHHFCTAEYYENAKGANGDDIKAFLGIN